MNNINTTLAQYSGQNKKSKDALAKVALTVAWQGDYEVSIGQDYVDFYKDNERIHSQIRRYPSCLSKELHYCWLTLLSKFKLDDSDMRISPVGVQLNG